MSEPTPKKTHELLEKLADYVMNEVPNKKELEIRLGEVRLAIEKRIQKVEEQLDQKADKKDIQIILNGMDGMVERLDVIQTEQSAFISGLRRLENRVEVLERKVD
jgi:hypothetical protein